MKLKSFLLIASLTIIITGCKETNPLVNQQSAAKNKPTQHLKLPEIASSYEATDVLLKTSEQLRAKTKLDANALHEIHMITYSLEKAIAYFVSHTNGEQNKTVNKMAIVVEELHLNSERGNKNGSDVALKSYFKLYDSFAKHLK